MWARKLVMFVGGLIILGIMGGVGPKRILAADCSCQTQKLADGSNTCTPKSSTCAAGETATCQFDNDGSCNYNLFNGQTCRCLAANEANPNANLGEGRVGGEFCTQEGHGVDTNDPWVNTAIGCVPVKVDKFVGWLLPYLFGIAGGISFLLMVYGFIIVATSGGDPKKMMGGQETITSAIMGLLTSIFAIFILRLITVGILKIPGMS